MFDMQKVMKVVPMPIAALIGVSIAGLVLSYIPVLGCIVGLPLMVAGWVVLGWAGFKASKEEGMDLVGGAVCGAVTGVVGGLIGGLINFAVIMLGFGASTLGSGDLAGAGVGAAIGGVALVFGLVFGVVLNTVLGAIFGAIGSYVATMKK
jgi:hypothetical protein